MIFEELVYFRDCASVNSNFALPPLHPPAGPREFAFFFSYG